MAKWPHEEVSTGGVLYPEGLLKVKITKQEDIEDNSGRFAIQVSGRILDPKDYKGQPYSMRFIIGMTADTAAKFQIDEDLGAENPETWTKNPSAGRYKSYLKACGVACTGDTEEEGEDVIGKTIFVQNAHREGKYNDAKAFYADDASSEAPAAPAAAAPKSGSLSRKSAASKPAPKTVEPEVADGGEDDWE